MDSLFLDYKRFEPIIKKQLREFKENWQSEKAIFEELIFCLLTPQSKALKCDLCVKELLSKDPGDWNTSFVEKILKKGSRFYRQKAKNVLIARDLFYSNGKYSIKRILIENGIEKDKLKVRDWLVKNIRGLGMKEASHFLRNIGFYDGIAIIDRHILKNMFEYGIIKDIPKTISKKKYIVMENALRNFSERKKIPMEALDLLFWAKKTGFVFK
ncbi:MAG: N-glycosylase/DNA lyase [Candidatus Diapherotrites archaeon]|nr:N-glycosylase/DNA lyase [Candidatus Diapherotrites archaeon]